MKRWFNRRFPYHRVCLKRWCWRVQTNQHRCHRHQALGREVTMDRDFDWG